MHLPRNSQRCVPPPCRCLFHCVCVLCASIHSQLHMLGKGIIWLSASLNTLHCVLFRVSARKSNAPRQPKNGYQFIFLLYFIKVKLRQRAHTCICNVAIHASDASEIRLCTMHMKPLFAPANEPDAPRKGLAKCAEIKSRQMQLCSFGYARILFAFASLCVCVCLFHCHMVDCEPQYFHGISNSSFLFNSFVCRRFCCSYFSTFDKRFAYHGKCSRRQRRCVCVLCAIASEGVPYTIAYFTTI